MSTDASSNTGPGQTPATLAKPTGLQHGGTGCVAAHLQSLGNAHGAALPTVTDAALEAYLTPPAKFWLKTLDRDLDYIQRERRKMPTLSEADRLTALEAMELICSPLSKPEIVELLAKLKLSTVARDLSTEEWKAQIKIYGQKLYQYPADVVRLVVASFCHSSKFFPTLSELSQDLELFAARRLRWLNFLRNPPASNEAPKKERATPEQIDAILARYHKQQASENPREDQT